MTRPLAFLLLLAVGVFTLPLMASVFDDAGMENYILPGAVLAVAGLGALLNPTLPFIPRRASSAGRLLFGALWGVALSLVGILISWFAISGLGGA